MSKEKIIHEIDRIDREIIDLLSKRNSLVQNALSPHIRKQAARKRRHGNASAQKVKKSAVKEGSAADAAANVYFPDI